MSRIIGDVFTQETTGTICKVAPVELQDFSKVRLFLLGTVASTFKTH